MENKTFGTVPTKMKLNIIYEDEYMLILEKEAGIAIHPTMRHYDNTLANGVKYYFDSIGLKDEPIHIVTRLDLGTSGLCIFAKSGLIQERLSKEMQDGNFEKYYLALCHGIFDEKEGIINAPIIRKEGSIIERTVDLNCTLEKAQAITKYRVLKEYIDKDNNDNSYSLVEFKLETGRTHQIRVHSSFIGHPLIGDTLYTNNEIKKEINEDENDNPYRSFQKLCAYKIKFIHPITNEKLEFEIKPDFVE